MRWQLLADLVQVICHLVQSPIVLLKVQGFVEMVHTQHVVRVLQWVDGDEVLERRRGPQGHRVQCCSIIIKQEQIP